MAQKIFQNDPPSKSDKDFIVLVLLALFIVVVALYNASPICQNKEPIAAYMHGGSSVQCD